MEKELRILGRGLTAQAIQKRYPNALMYDDNNKDEFDIIFSCDYGSYFYNCFIISC